MYTGKQTKSKNQRPWFHIQKSKTLTTGHLGASSGLAEPPKGLHDVLSSPTYSDTDALFPLKLHEARNHVHVCSTLCFQPLVQSLHVAAWWMTDRWMDGWINGWTNILRDSVVLDDQEKKKGQREGRRENDKGRKGDWRLPWWCSG